MALENLGTLEIEKVISLLAMLLRLGMSSESNKKKGVFIKFGELEHLRQLQSGLLYCNSLDFFATLEETNVAADKYENITYLRDFSGGTISFWPAEEPKPESPLHMTPEWCQMTTSHGQLGNIFCLHFLDVSKLVPDGIGLT
jgi:hypothetical protein